MKTKVVLCFSGHDPSGGAGQQADIEAIKAMGAQAVTVLTTLTIQNTKNVIKSEPLHTDWVIQQTQTLLQDIEPAAIKVSLPGSFETLKFIESVVAKHKNIPLIVDPVLQAGGGKTLVDTRLKTEIKNLLISKSLLTTPNISELKKLTNTTSKEQALNKLFDTGCQYILLKSADDSSETIKQGLYTKKADIHCLKQWEIPKLPANYHGSGCTLAAAITGLITQGKSILEACEQAQNWTMQSLTTALTIGDGQKIPNRRA